MKTLLSLLAISPLLIAPAIAQTGTLDQVSPFSSEALGFGAGYNFDATSLTWQAEVFAGMDGTLEGFEFELTGPAGSSMDVAVHLGSPWQTSTPVWSGVVSKVSGSVEIIFVDVSAANIVLSTGDAYTIEIHGGGNGMGGTGTYEAPVNTFYAPNLYLNAALFGPEWRIGFHTWMIAGNALTLSTTGAPGGAMTFDVTGATANGPLAYLYAFGTGSYTRINPFTGNVLTTGLSSAGITVANTPSADGSGNYSLPSNVPSAAAGVICVQVVDLLSDGLSNVVSL